MKILCIGDVMIPSTRFEAACSELNMPGSAIQATDWETDWDHLQNRRLLIEQQGPTAEPVLPEITGADPLTEMLFILFAPVSAAAMDALPSLRLIGASRAGLENIDVAAATERGIIVHNVMGRNAHAVSDFAIGLMFAEARNIGRAHAAIKAGQWRKSYANSDFLPEISGKTLGIVGFGYIGSLVAKKLAGFDLDILVYDPFVSDEALAAAGARRATKEELFSNADFVSVHARLTPETEGLVGPDEIACMKPTAIFINSGRAGLVNEDALYAALKERRIGGAALDVFWKEPLAEDSRWLALDNVTLTPHIAGTTADALNNSPFLLTRDVELLLSGEKPRFIVNPEVLDHPAAREWLAGIRG